MADFFSVFFEIVLGTGLIYLGVISGFLFIKSPLAKFRGQFISILLNICTPFLIFIAIVQLESSNNFIVPIIASIGVSLLGYWLPILIAKISKQPRSTPEEQCNAAFPNALNFPFPIIFALVPQSLGLASIFLVTQIVLRNTFGLWISGVKITRKEIKTVFLFPPLIGIILGGITKLSLTIFSFDLSSLGPSNNFFVFIFFQVSIFATLMTLGFSITKPAKVFYNSYIRVGLTRYILTPLILFPLIFLVTLSPVVLIPLIVQIIAPPAVYNSLYAEKFKLDVELTSNVIVILTMIALIFVPLEYWFLIQINNWT